MNRFYLLIFPISIALTCCGDKVQPYVALEKLQQEIVDEICCQYDLVPSGISSSCLTAIRNLYWSFSSKKAMAEYEAKELLYNIFVRVMDRVNSSKDISIIKLKKELDLDFFHLVLFFRAKDELGDASVALMKGWEITQRYNYFGNETIYKVKRPISESIEEMGLSDSFPRFESYKSFSVSPEFGSHLLRVQPYGDVFVEFGNRVCSLLVKEGLVSARMDDRSSNNVDSAFGVVRKVFFFGEWIIPSVAPYSELSNLFQRALNIILREINKDDSIHAYLHAPYFTVDNVELVLRPYQVYKNEDETYLAGIYNIGRNIIFLLSYDYNGGGNVSFVEEYSEPFPY